MPSRALLSALIAVAAPAALARNLVVNPSFEAPALPSGALVAYTAGQDLGGWTVESGGVDQAHRTFWQAREGMHSLDLNGTSVGGIRQTIATQPGALYELSFAYAGNPGCAPGVKTLGVYWNGPIVHSATFDTSSTSAGAMGWAIPQSLLLRATSASTELAFRALSPVGDCGPALDRIELVPRLHADRGLRLASVAQSGQATGNALSELYSRGGFLSANGRFVVFSGDASDLVPNDGNGTYDVFVRDLVTGTTELISRKAGTTASANGLSADALLSADGRWVAFISRASDLATAGPNPAAPGLFNVYLHDRQTRATRLVSVDANGAGTLSALLGASRISDDGRWVAFTSASPNVVGIPTGSFRQLYLRDMQAGTTTLVSRNVAGTAGANFDVGGGSMSRDGRWLAFSTLANDLTPTIDGNGESDVILHDRTTGLNTMASRGMGGWSGNGRSALSGLSANGSRVVFESAASDLLPGDGNGATDVFAYEPATGALELVSCGPGCNASAAGTSDRPRLSDDGRFVAFDSTAPDLVAGDTNGARDVLVRDLERDVTELISVGATGPDGNGTVAISADGRWVGFQTASALTADDATNASIDDFFARDRASGTTYLLSRGEHGSAGGPEEAAFSADGRRVAFSTDWSTLSTQADVNDDMDVFTVDLALLDRLFGDGFD